MDITEIRKRNKDMLDKITLKSPQINFFSKLPSKTVRHSDQNISFGKHHQWFPHHHKSSDDGNWKKRRKKFNPDFERMKREKKKQEAVEFRYGNYHQYYGYRNQGQMDSRILCMKQEWFSGKDVLDIGCNAGHFTLDIARNFSPKSIIGVDIDNELVKMAMRNVRHYIKSENISEEDFPISLVLSYGPAAQAIDPKGRYPDGNFPFNVQFVQGNFILPSDEQVKEQGEYFDTILCLSVTKWIHLNWGDAGIKRLFHRMYNQIRPGGSLILEAQTYQSYARKKKITEEVFRHYNNIELYPEMFNEYLLKKVGFETCELIDTPAHSSQGFSRPIYLFTKGGSIEEWGDKQPKHVIYQYSSDSYCEDSDVEQLSD